jgi:hypothetical protein
VLAGHHDGVQPHRLEAVVLDGDLGLAVRPQVGHRAVLADGGEPAGQPVRERDRQRHSSGVSEHAKPNIMPWSPAPWLSSGSAAPSLRFSIAASTPCAMSGDCEPIETLDAARRAVEALLRTSRSRCAGWFP